MDQFEQSQPDLDSRDQVDDDDDLGIVTSLVDLNELLRVEEHVNQLIQNKDYMNLFMKALVTERKLIAPLVARMDLEGFTENDKLFFRAIAENLEEKQNQFKKMQEDYEEIREVNRGLKLEQEKLKKEELEARINSEKAEKLLSDEKDISLQHSLEITKKTKELEQYKEIQKFLEEQKVDLKNAIKYFSEIVIPAYEKAQDASKKEIQELLKTISDQRLKIQEIETRQISLQTQAKQDIERIQELEGKLNEVSEKSKTTKLEQIRKISSDKIQSELIFEQETRLLQEEEQRIKEFSEELQRQRENFRQEMDDRNRLLDEKLERHMSQVDSLERQQQSIRDMSKRQSLVITKEPQISYDWVLYVLLGIGLRQILGLFI